MSLYPVETPESRQSDADLIARYRAGDSSAAAELYRRHSVVVRRFARRLAGTDAADDLVSEVFANVLSTIQRGGGPEQELLPYLLTAVRHTWYRVARRERRHVPTDDLDTVSTTTLLEVDDVTQQIESAELADAFRSLPRRWQEVLVRHTLNDDPLEITAVSMQIKPAAVAALSYRARRGLRRAYLDVADAGA